jgi:hypothetical protein
VYLQTSTTVYKLFTEQYDEDSISISQCLKQMITDLVLGRKDYEDSLECSIESETEKNNHNNPNLFSKK